MTTGNGSGQSSDVIPFDSRLPAQARYHGPVSGMELFPEDRWTDIPKLPDGMKEFLAEEKSTFLVLDVFERTSEKFGDPFWVTIIQMIPDGTTFSAPFSASESGFDRWRVVQEALRAGATEVGPFYLQSIDTGKGNPFMKLCTVLPNDLAVRNATSLLQVKKASKPTQQASLPH
jgi:hypothetical protein